MKKILGITGGIGAGKSFVANLFAELGATIVDADKIAREILEPKGHAFENVVDAFGNNILKEDGTIDRKKLAGIVFADKEKLDLLNGLTHPAVFEEMQREIENANDGLVCLDVPLLFTCDFPIHCDRTLAVMARKEIRLERILDRDHCTEEAAEERMANQLSDEEFKKRADICIWNDGDEEKLRRNVAKIYYQMIKR